MEYNGLIKFQIPGLNGPRTVSGTVKRILPNAKLEVKTQNDGYFTIRISEIIPKDVWSHCQPSNVIDYNPRHDE